jgi:hypothetical protein
MAPFAAALMNRYGLRNVTLLALLIVVSGLVASLAMTQVWQRCCWGVVIELGTGMTALVLGLRSPRAGSWRGAAWWSAYSPQTSRPGSCLPAAIGEPDRSYGWRLALALVCVMLGWRPSPC